MQHQILRQPSFSRPVGAGGCGHAMAPPDFYRLINPFTTRGVLYAQHINVAPSPQIFRPSYGPDVNKHLKNAVLQLVYL